MTLLEAINARHSVRRYHERPLDPASVDALRAEINRINAATGLNIQLVLNEPKAFKGIFAYGKFSGVTNYLVMAGPKGPGLDELIGYHGEHLVLLAQTLGLNSCWAGLSYRKVAGTYTLGANQKIACYIALGYGVTQGSPRKTKTIRQVSNADAASPQWFTNGVKAALLAPTAVNQQKFRFDYLGGDRVKASRLFSPVGYTRIDLGIAKLHFTLAAAHPITWKDHTF